VDEPAPNASSGMPVSIAAAAKPAIGFIDRQRQPAEIGEFFPDVSTEAERLGCHAGRCVRVIGLGQRSGRPLSAQQALLVAQARSISITSLAADF